jgi:hypothetical protein
VEAGCGFTTSSMVGAVLPHPVWQGSAWSRSWSSFWSPAKQGRESALQQEAISEQSRDFPNQILKSAAALIKRSACVNLSCFFVFDLVIIQRFREVCWFEEAAAAEAICGGLEC